MPLIADLVISFDTLASRHKVSLPHLELELRLPGVEWTDGKPQSTTPEGFDRVPGDSHPGWGHSTSNAEDRSGQALLSALALTVDAEVTVLTEEDGPDGHDAPEYVVDLEAWIVRLERWISVIANQPLDPLRPRSALISPRSTSIITWIDDAEGERLTTQAGAGSIPVVVRGHGPRTWYDELVVTPDVLSDAVGRANAGGEPSIIADLWARAQHAINIKDYRACLVDLGTVAEAALVELDPTRQQDGTLGQKVQRVRSYAALPTDIDTGLVALRNRVVHDAYLPTRAEAVRAGEIVELLVAPVRQAIGFVAHARGTPTHRPARADLTIFRSA